MLHILLLILKIIGIILLCILGILILGIICVLFVPVRYRIEAVRQEGEGNPPVVVRAKAAWLLHLINLSLCFDGALSMRIRVAVITFFRRPGKRAKDEEETPEDGQKKSRKKEKERKTAKSESVDESAEQDTKGNASPQMSTEEEERQSDTGLEDSPGTFSFFEKLRTIPKILRDILSKIKSFFENIQYTIQKFCDKIRAVSKDAVYYRELLESELFKRSYALCKDELIAIGKWLKPDKFEAQLVVGLDDPAATGEVLAVCGILYPFLGGQVDVAGDFEKKRLEGRVFVKGRLRLFTLLRIVIKIYYNKDLRKLIRLFKKEAV